MKKICVNITSFFLFFLTLFSSTAYTVIFETHDISEIRSSIQKGTLVLFDIDDTLMCARTELNSGRWIEYLWKLANASMPEKINIVHSLMWHVSEYVPVMPIDSLTPALISDLQEMEDVVALAFTARFPVFTASSENITAMQLEKIGVNFSKTDYPKQLDDHHSFHQGIIFSAGKIKGPHLQDMLQTIDHIPAKVVFVDDKLKQVVSVHQTMEAMGIPCDCYWYRQSELRHTKLDPVLAAIQLEYFLHHQIFINNHEAGTLREKYSERVIEEFLKELIDHYEVNHLSGETK